LDVWTYIPQRLNRGWIIPTRVEKVAGGLGAVQGVFTKEQTVGEIHC
jgi:hypothetical protein